MKSARRSFRDNVRGQIIGEAAGFVKLVFSPEDQRLLGAAVVGEGACELIHVAGAVLGFHGTIDYFHPGRVHLPDAERGVQVRRVRRTATHRQARQPPCRTSGHPGVARPVTCARSAGTNFAAERGPLAMKLSMPMRMSAVAQHSPNSADSSRSPSASGRRHPLDDRAADQGIG